MSMYPLIDGALASGRMGKSHSGVGPPKCAGCGKFIAYNDLERSRFEFEPLSEYGPEVAEWVCFRCVEEESAHDRTK